ncbi:uncharacterized protein involved in response to NO [Rhodobium orientis]|uniref:Short-chain dehydrogenase n=1 Tax=Rhodobium orientis TaxID=34017 RepID=A0A327JMY3_9HYPH|nr:NnrS family protein [Rhodobium orientis]MBB4303260.1 uncharacterized protein involved in response to NO [Rhodobium orientis]MBK5951640.1 short-chain dehydrogenase [Rhodobium orientis]RAI27840.1 short-chain dehydrogenase [Rhodobium orientis]
MTSSAERIRRYSGPAILSYGFRPLFFSAGLWALCAMGLWLLMLSGELDPPMLFGPIDWHAHELLYGYLPAAAAGFLLTAVPNWTGRLPVTGVPLAGLALCWWAGRIAVLFSAFLGAPFAAAIDLSFLVLLAAIIAREIVAGRNWRNLKVLVLIALLLIGNAVFHIEAPGGAAADGYGGRIGIAAAVFLIMLIGGRIVPSFTRNWLVRRGTGRLPAPFGTFDKAALGVSAAALIAWGLLPGASATLLLCLLAGVLQFVRLARWAPERTLAEPLVWVLHLGYAFVPAGFLLVAAAGAGIGDIQRTAALHAWTAGAIGIMTLAVMTRATLGHTGRPLTATPATTAIYGLAAVSVLARLLAGTGLAPQPLLYVAGLSWMATFAVFTLVYGPMFWRRRK